MIITTKNYYFSKINFTKILMESNIHFYLNFKIKISYLLNT